MLSAIFLIPACSIGAGLLSFPVITGLSGFMPSSLVILFGWAFATLSGLTILNLCYAAKERTNKDNPHFFTISETFLPKALKLVCLGLFLAINYASLTGYVAASPAIYKSFFTSMIPDKLVGLAVVAILFLVSQLNTKNLCRINNVLTPGMFAAYLALLYLGFESYDSSNLKHSDFSLIYTSVPMIVTAFSYQFIVPTIAGMMNVTKRMAQACVIIGSSFNCLIYLFWNFTILGCIPLPSLLLAYKYSKPITAVLTGKSLILAGNIFAIFSLLTSFISITLCMLGYWKDYLQTERSLVPSIYVFVPIIAVFMLFDKLFLWIFSLTGGYGDSLLFGLMPVYAMLSIGKRSWQVVILGIMSALILGTQIFLDSTSFFG